MITRGVFTFMLSLSLIAEQGSLPTGAGAGKDTGSISGVVRDSGTGVPLAQLPVRGGSASTTTNAEGQYTLSGVHPGRHSVVVGAPSRATTAYGIKTITLTAGMDLSGIDFKLQVKGSISGKVRDANNEPVPGLEVVLVGREYLAGDLRYYRRNQTFTNDQGEYRIQNVLPGTPYLILARQLNRRPDPISRIPVDPKLRRQAAIPTYYPNSPSPGGGELITLRSREQREGVDIIVVRSQSYCIQGVLSLDGRPGELGYWIHERQMSFGLGASGGTTGIPPGGKSGPDGKIRICDLHPGDYRLTAFSGDLNDPLFIGSTQVTIVDSDIDRIAVAAGPRELLSGQIVWAGTPPINPNESLATVVLTSLHRSVGRITAGAVSSIPGEFVVKQGPDQEHLLVDEYHVRVSGLTGGLYLKDIIYGDTSVMCSPLRLGSSTAGAGLRVVVGNDGGFVRVTVKDRDDKSVPGAIVVLMPKDARSLPELAAMRITGQTDQNGSYLSGALSPGTYFILATLASVTDWSPESTAKLWRARLKAKEVDVGSNATVQLSVEPISVD